MEMEPDQRSSSETDHQDKLHTSNEQKEQKTEGKITADGDSESTISQAASCLKTDSKEISSNPSEVSSKETEDKPKEEKSSDQNSDEGRIQIEQKSNDEKLTNEKSESENKTSVEAEIKATDKKNEEENEVEEIIENKQAKPHLPSFPGTVTKSVPGSNDVKIEIASSSLLDRVILYSLKNTVVDNSRLNAAKKKYILNNGNITSNFSSSSNGSDSNSSSKSVEKLIEEFKGGCSKSIDENTSNEPETKSDFKSESTKVDVNTNNRSLCSNDELASKENHHTVIASLPNKDQKSIALLSADVPKVCEEGTVDDKLPKVTPPNSSLTDEGLDFREESKTDKVDVTIESSPAMLDLSTPHRDEKSVPHIKRNHALYVGLPDFSKQIFTAPSITRPTNTITTQQVPPPKIENPAFASSTQTTPEFQVRNPDFSKSFSRSEAASHSPAITPSNFPEIVRKNNYISDLQLKPAPASTATTSQYAPAPSYKIDYRTSTGFSQKLIQESSTEHPSTSQPIYPNMKKEGINAYKQQLIIEEPMAHIIHKNQFLPHSNETPQRGGGWNGRPDGMASSSFSSPQLSGVERNPPISSTYQSTSDDLRKNSSSYYHPNSKESISQENHQQMLEFSLKHKEQQLRQEGTIITIKNEPTRTSMRDTPDRHSADLFRDYKLKQPKESPNAVRRLADFQMSGYQQAYPDFPKYPPHIHQSKVETIVKPNHSSSVPPTPQAYSHDRHMNQIPQSSYYNQSTVPYHQDSKSPLSSVMNPPQGWPTSAMPHQPLARPGPSNISSPSPVNYQHHSSPSQSPHHSYGQSYPIAPPVAPSAVKGNQSTQHYRNVDVASRSYMQSASSSISQNYYHQNYPDFSRHFEPDKKTLIRDPSMKHPALADQRQMSEVNYRKPSPHNESGIIAHRDQSQLHRDTGYPGSREHAMGNSQEYSALVQKHVRHQSVPEIAREQIRPPQPVKIEEPPKIMAGPSLNASLRKPEPSEVKVETVKLESSLMPNRSMSSSIIKSTKSIFAEVKRESPLDLSVKTVKTKADSTGCDQDSLSNNHPAPSRLKVEFTPNFSKASKSESRDHSRMGGQSHAAPVPERSIRPQENDRMLNITHPTSSRNYYQDHGWQPLKEIERPRAPIPSLQNNPQFPGKQIIHHPNNTHEALRVPPLKPPPPNDTYLRENNKFEQLDPRRQPHQYYMPQQSESRVEPSGPAYPTIGKVIHQQAFRPEAPKSSYRTPNHSVDPRDPQREKDRRYVEEILNRQSRKEQPPSHLEMHQFQPIASPPRKRIVETQHMNNSVPTKQSKTEILPRAQNASKPMLQNPSTNPFYGQQYQPKVENQMKPAGYPMKAVNNEIYMRPIRHPYEPDLQSKIVVSSQQPNIHPPYQSGPYYPNPKAEMIQRSDSLGVINKDEKLQYQNPNFQRCTDDSASQFYQRNHHPNQREGCVTHEYQPAGPVQRIPTESTSLMNGILQPSNVGRGADQSTIMKLKTNLELKEQKRLTFSKGEPGEDHDSSQKKDLSPRQFRTKGELKGFIPVPPTNDSKNDTLQAANTSAFDLLDWGTACNDLVQQLECGIKRPKKKRVTPSADNNPDQKPLIEASKVTTTSNLSEVPKTIINSLSKKEKNSSSDEDKPLLELVSTQHEDGDVKKNHLDVVEKISRNIREKKRLQLEQKHAARLGDPSSSENENEISRPARTAIKIRRLRKRAALGMKKTDEELSVEEEETEEEAPSKRRSTRYSSKLDDLSSSDDDKKKQPKERKSDDKKHPKSSKKSAKTQESSSVSSESDDTTDKITKLSTAKNVKKLKDLGDGSSFKNLLEEEETMTRSKRKLEIEKKLSNSKILRNEKVVRNVAPDKKMKTETSPIASKKVLLKRKNSVKTEDSKRKTHESDSDKNVGKSKRQRHSSKIESSSSSEETNAEEENKAERLRPRKNKPENETLSRPLKESAKKKNNEKTPPVETLNTNNLDIEAKRSLPNRVLGPGAFSFKDEKTSRFTPGWEAETYNFKRSLKIPAGLITIGRPPQHGISHSLPDLDPQTSDTSEIFSEFVRSKDKEGIKEGDAATSSKSQKVVKQKPKKASSIIDLLHQRVVQSKRKFRAKKSSNPVGSSSQADDELLPTPEKESEKVFGFKKNIFETSVLTSRTRTENNAMRKKEILKEVFGADDERPKSAPPVSALEDVTETATTPEADKKISYDQKYREYLEKMNVDFLSKTSENVADEKTAGTSIKDDEEDDDDNETVVASEIDLTTPTLKLKAKKGRGRRCKGSSGFDYIRKKKKPTPNASENPLSVNNIIKKRLAAMENLVNKDEDDIRKEIKGWVLNKGVGESVLHKASRLDYVDVIAYCLDRLNMTPDPKDNAGYTPLHEACSRGHLEIARILLQYGANHSETALSGIRPLHEAIENGHVEIVRLLISYGADPCLATYSGQLPISMAEDKEMEDFLNEYLIDVDNKKGRTTSWYFEGPYKLEDPCEDGFEVFENIPINKTGLGSSVASVLSTSLTSLVTATTQMSDNETVTSETNVTPIKVPPTPMKAPSQDLMKFQHKMKKCDTNSNNIVMSDVNNHENNNKLIASGKKTKGCSVVLNSIDSMKKIKKLPSIPKLELPKAEKPIQKVAEIKEDYDDMTVDGDSDCEFLELEESEAPLPPLYLLKDEGSDKWILLTDLCNLLKVKSKDAVLKQICPSSPPSVNKELIRELKMSDFLEKAICLQLFCAGEKLNVRASKVSLVRYNDSVRNLLGVQTIRMNM